MAIPVEDQIEDRFGRIQRLRDNIVELEHLRGVQDQLQHMVEEVERNRELLGSMREELNRLQGERDQVMQQQQDF